MQEAESSGVGLDSNGNPNEEFFCPIFQDRAGVRLTTSASGINDSSVARVLMDNIALPRDKQILQDTENVDLAFESACYLYNVSLE